MKNTESKEWVDLKEAESRLTEAIKGCRGQIASLAHDPVFHNEEIQSLQAEIKELESQLKEVLIAAKLEEIKTLEAE